MDNVIEVITYIVVAGLLGFPFWRILHRAGLSPYFALLVLIPWLGYLAVEAMLAFARWPRVEQVAMKPRGTI